MCRAEATIASQLPPRNQLLSSSCRPGWALTRAKLPSTMRASRHPQLPRRIATPATSLGTSAPTKYCF